MSGQTTIKVPIRVHALAYKLAKIFDVPMGDVIGYGLQEIEKAGKITIEPLQALRDSVAQLPELGEIPTATLHESPATYTAGAGLTGAPAPIPPPQPIATHKPDAPRTHTPAERAHILELVTQILGPKHPGTLQLAARLRAAGPNPQSAIRNPKSKIALNAAATAMQTTLDQLAKPATCHAGQPIQPGHCWQGYHAPTTRRGWNQLRKTACPSCPVLASCPTLKAAKS